MKITDIHDKWGSIVQLESPEEFFLYNTDYWRDLIYKRGVIFFKQVKFTNAEYAEFGLHFGLPWHSDDYAYSRENVEPVDTEHGEMTLSPITNTAKRLGMSDMPWHADIPNRIYKPFPFRSLWIVSNPNPTESGKTSWLNLEQAIDYLTSEMKELLPRVKIIQQSWYTPGTDIKEFDLLKTHPITGKQSLRLNYYNWEKNVEAWICGVKIDGISQADCSLVREWLTYLEKIPELNYTHMWDTYDIAIYDNWPFVHNRTQLKFNGDAEIRKFYRINIDHLDNQEWQQHAAKYF
jgi:alpha-ketoglutarate-dependent taurine dioxygenase